MMRCVDVGQFGGPEQMSIVSKPKPVVGAHDLLVKVTAVGVNRADILQRQGRYPPPAGVSDVLGLEMCGEVVAMGELAAGSAVGNAGRQITIGCKVFGIVPGGAYAEYCLLDAAMAFELPANMTDIQGAAFAEAYLTAYQAIYHIAGLPANPVADNALVATVLIHAGASGVGSAAIQLVKALGGRVVTTVGSEEKRQFCLAMGADLAINYQQDDFVAVMKAQGYRANVVVDCIAGEYIKRDLAVMANDGYLVLLAMMGGRYVESLDIAQLLAKRLTIVGSTLRDREPDYKRTLVARFKHQCAALMASGKIAPVVDKVYDIQEVKAAHDYIEGNHNKGKVVLTFA